jgi:hypothetical protein
VMSVGFFAWALAPAALAVAVGMTRRLAVSGESAA